MRGNYSGDSHIYIKKLIDKFVRVQLERFCIRLWRAQFEEQLDKYGME